MNRILVGLFVLNSEISVLMKYQSGSGTLEMVFKAQTLRPFIAIQKEESMTFVLL